MNIIEQTLCYFGITRCYRGYEQAIYCISLAVEDDFRLTAVTKELYMPTAERFNCRWTAVERNMRTVVRRAWLTDHQLLEQMAGYPLRCEPTVSEFIEIVTYHVKALERVEERGVGAS